MTKNAGATPRFSSKADKLTARVAAALRSERRMHLDADGWYVDSETGKLIGPDPEMERELTEADFARARYSVGGNPVSKKKFRRAVRKAVGRPKSTNPKQPVNLRLDADVLAHFRSTGPGWQTRINATLRRAAKLGKVG